MSVRAPAEEIKKVANYQPQLDPDTDAVVRPGLASAVRRRTTRAPT